MHINNHGKQNHPDLKPNLAPPPSSEAQLLLLSMCPFRPLSCRPGSFVLVNQLQLPSLALTLILTLTLSVTLPLTLTETT